MKIFKIKEKTKQLRKKSFKTKSDLYWMLILLITVLLILQAFIFGYKLYLDTSKDISGYEEAVNSKKAESEKEKIEKGLDIFTQRENESIKILNSPSPAIDPSI